jgi:hypothetical protein
MQLLVATWTLRIAIVAALAVGGVSYQAGAPVIDCVDRALGVAVGFTLAGRLLMGWLEPPEVKMLKLRQKREAKRAKARIAATADSVAAARARRSASTISRSA